MRAANVTCLTRTRAKAAARGSGSPQGGRKGWECMGKGIEGERNVHTPTTPAPYLPTRAPGCVPARLPGRLSHGGYVVGYVPRAVAPAPHRAAPTVCLVRTHHHQDQDHPPACCTMHTYVYCTYLRRYLPRYSARQPRAGTARTHARPSAPRPSAYVPP